MYDPTFQSKVFPYLRELFTPLASIWDGRFYFIVPPDSVTYPCGVYQSQDSGGRKDDAIDQSGWRGLVTFRSIARSLGESESNLIDLASALQSLTHQDIDFTIRLQNPIPLPIEQDSISKIYTMGLITDIGIYPK